MNKLIELFKIISEVMGVFADKSKLPDTDERGIQFWEIPDSNTFVLRFVTVDNIMVEIEMDEPQIDAMVADPRSYIGELVLMVKDHISSRRDIRAQTGSIVIPSTNQIADVMSGSMH